MNVFSTIIAIFLGITLGLILIFMEVRSEMSRMILIHACTEEQMCHMFLDTLDMLKCITEQYSERLEYFKYTRITVKYSNGYCVDILFRYGDIRRCAGMRPDLWYTDSVDDSAYIRSQNRRKGIQLNYLKDVRKFIDILCECKESK